MNFTSLIPDQDDEQQLQQQKPWMRSRFGNQQTDDMGYTMARAENGGQAPPPAQPQPAANGNGPVTIPQQKSAITQPPPQQIGPPDPESTPNLTAGEGPTQADQTQQLEGLMPQMKTGGNAGVVHPPTPVEQMEAAGKESAGLGPRPTNLQDIPADQRHHGWRKFGDIAAALGIGVYTMNPLAGVGVYNQMSRAPLRKAQGTYDSSMAAAQGKFKTAQEIEKQNIGEDRVAALESKNKGLEAEREAKTSKMNETFVAGTEQEDKNSPTGWTAQTVGGERKPFEPKQGKPTLGEANADYEKEADRLQLKGDERKYYIANHKLKEPGTNIHVPSAETERYHNWRNAFHQEHGRWPTADEEQAQKFNPGAGKGNQHTFKDAAAVDKYSDDWYAKQRKAVLDEKVKVKTINPDAAGDDKTLQAEYAKIESSYQQRARQFENEKKNWYTQLQGGKPVSVEESEGGVPALAGNAPPAANPQGAAPGATPAKPAAQQPPAATTPKQGPPVGGGYSMGQQVNVDGKPAYVIGFNPKTGKPKTSRRPPAS